MNNIQPKNNVDSALLQRIALCVLDVCDYDILNQSYADLLELTRSVCHSEADYISNGFIQYSSHGVDYFVEYATNLVDRHSDYMLLIIHECYQVVMKKRRHLLEIFRNNSLVSPTLPPDQIIF